MRTSLARPAPARLKAHRQVVPARAHDAEAHPNAVARHQTPRRLRPPHQWGRGAARRRRQTTPLLSEFLAKLLEQSGLSSPHGQHQQRDSPHARGWRGSGPSGRSGAAGCRLSWSSGIPGARVLLADAFCTHSIHGEKRELTRSLCVRRVHRLRVHRVTRVPTSAFRCLRCSNSSLRACARKWAMLATLHGQCLSRRRRCSARTRSATT